MSYGNAWQNALIHLMKDSEFTFIRTELLVAIKDKYAKASHHFLILPYEESLDTVYDLRQEHLELLNEMELLATNCIEVIGNKVENFKIGFHIKPSMSRLHLHVVSKDFNSPALKHKKHWNSFNTDFLYTIDRVRKDLEKFDYVEEPKEEIIKEYLNRPLKCNTCSYVPKHMPDLKKHLLTHLSNYV